MQYCKLVWYPCPIQVKDQRHVHFAESTTDQEDAHMIELSPTFDWYAEETTEFDFQGLWNTNVSESVDTDAVFSTHGIDS